MERKEYSLCLIVNEIVITKVVIDPHYEIKHKQSINDELILQLVRKLDNKKYFLESENNIFKYFVTDKINLNGNLYKLIWLLENNKNYIGVVNAYRR